MLTDLSDRLYYNSQKNSIVRNEHTIWITTETINFSFGWAEYLIDLLTVREEEMKLCALRMKSLNKERGYWVLHSPELDVRFLSPFLFRHQAMVGVLVSLSGVRSPECGSHVQGLQEH